MCAKLGVLPGPGGLFQQHPLHVMKLEKVYEAQAVVDRDEQQKQESQRRLKDL